MSRFVNNKNVRATSVTIKPEQDKYTAIATWSDKEESYSGLSPQEVYNECFDLLKPVQQGFLLKKHADLFSQESLLDDDNDIPSEITAKSFQYSMPILGGFIAALGVAAVAVAFTALSAASLGIVGLAVAAIGAAATLAGVGLFAVSSLRQCRLAPEPSVSEMALSN